MLKWVYGGIGDQSTFLELELVLLYWDSKNKWSHWCNCSFRHNPTGSVVFNEDSTSWGRLKRERKREGRKERKKKRNSFFILPQSQSRPLYLLLFYCLRRQQHRSIDVFIMQIIVFGQQQKCYDDRDSADVSEPYSMELFSRRSHRARSSLVEVAIEQGAL